jgi:hypothetical protein
MMFNVQSHEIKITQDNTQRQKLSNVMRNYIIPLFIIVTLTAVNGQSKRVKRAERQAVRDSVEMAQHTLALMAIKDTLLVLEADQAFNKRGEMVNVDGTLNFIAINKGVVSVQLAFPFLIGPNGVGGITMEGRLTSYEIKETKYGNIIIYVRSFGNSLNADINITLYANGNQADARVSASTLPYQLSFNGKLIYLTNSSYFKGTPLF